MAGLTYDLAAVHHLPDFRCLIGAGWGELPPPVQRRFACHEPRLYSGQMLEVNCSFVGLLFAWVCRLFGPPLVYRTGIDVPTDVTVYPTEDQRGMVWERLYRFAGSNVIARSVKTWHEDLGLMECVTGGLGMLLAVDVDPLGIHFCSQRYFLKVLGVHLPIPGWMTPGTTRVTHRDIGGGEFAFELSIVHPLFGETFFQRGVFRDPGC